MKIHEKPLPIIVFSQFCCTSLWFAGNAVMDDLLLNFGLDTTALGHLTSAVQLGFIAGTLIFAFFGLADRFRPSVLFFVCALAGAIFNLSVSFDGNNLDSLLLWRFLTGVSLAGIYPVGMKIVADHYRQLGRSLGFLVGALVLGTAFPHLLKTLTGSGGLPWQLVIAVTSSIAVLGGLLILLLVPQGPFRKTAVAGDSLAFYKVFKDRSFRTAAFGYFGHMWELYTFWAFIPLILSTWNLYHPEIELDIPLISFLIIGSGGIACVAGGYLSQTLGTKNTATGALLLSGICCLLSPFFFIQDSAALLISFLIFWGIVVVADSPLFSALIAKHAPAESRGTALTIVNCLGFTITILSLQLITFLLLLLDPLYILMLLAPGPAFGVWRLVLKQAGE